MSHKSTISDNPLRHGLWKLTLNLRKAGRNTKYFETGASSNRNLNRAKFQFGWIKRSNTNPICNHLSPKGQLSYGVSSDKNKSPKGLEGAANQGRGSTRAGVGILLEDIWQLLLYRGEYCNDVDVTVQLIHSV